MAANEHELDAIALAYARCKCGWIYRVETFKGKSDEDLAIEVGTTFEHHRAMESK